MARRDLLTGDERRALFGVPLDHASLAKHYTVADEDRPLIEAKRGDANRLGFALHLALLRHPGFGLSPAVTVEPALVARIGKARRDGLVDLHVHDLRSWTHDRHRTVDDTPYGGGAGMVMKPEPWALALEHVAAQGPVSPAPAESSSAEPGDRPVLLVPTPSGERFTQRFARELAGREHVAIACGRYEGIDERVFGWAEELFEVRLVSLGDYVLNGGEVAALAMIEAVGRLVPGVVGNPASLVEESHEDGLLEYPVYTKPADWRGRAVPPVLLSGDHGKVAAWRRAQQEERTRERRPDLWAAYDSED